MKISKIEITFTENLELNTFDGIELLNNLSQKLKDLLRNKGFVKGDYKIIFEID